MSYSRKNRNRGMGGGDIAKDEDVEDEDIAKLY